MLVCGPPSWLRWGEQPSIDVKSPSYHSHHSNKIQIIKRNHFKIDIEEVEKEREREGIFMTFSFEF